MLIRGILGRQGKICDQNVKCIKLPSPPGEERLLIGEFPMIKAGPGKYTFLIKSKKGNYFRDLNIRTGEWETGESLEVIRRNSIDNLYFQPVLGKKTYRNGHEIVTLATKNQLLNFNLSESTLESETTYKWDSSSIAQIPKNGSYLITVQKQRTWGGDSSILEIGRLIDLQNGEIYFEQLGGFYFESKLLQLAQLEPENMKYVRPESILHSEVTKDASDYCSVNIILKTVNNLVFALQLKEQRDGRFSVDYNQIQLLIEPRDVIPLDQKTFWRFKEGDVNQIRGCTKSIVKYIPSLDSIIFLDCLSQSESQSIEARYFDVKSKALIASANFDSGFSDPFLLEVFINQSQPRASENFEAEFYVYLVIAESKSYESVKKIIPVKVHQKRCGEKLTVEFGQESEALTLEQKDFNFSLFFVDSTPYFASWDLRKDRLSIQALTPQLTPKSDSKCVGISQVELCKTVRMFQLLKDEHLKFQHFKDGKTLVGLFANKYVKYYVLDLDEGKLKAAESKTNFELLKEMHDNLLQYNFICLGMLQTTKARCDNDDHGIYLMNHEKFLSNEVWAELPEVTDDETEKIAEFVKLNMIVKRTAAQSTEEEGEVEKEKKVASE